MLDFDELDKLDKTEDAASPGTSGASFDHRLQEGIEKLREEMRAEVKGLLRGALAEHFEIQDKEIKRLNERVSSDQATLASLSGTLSALQEEVTRNGAKDTMGPSVSALEQQLSDHTNHVSGEVSKIMSHVERGLAENKAAWKQELQDTVAHINDDAVATLRGQCASLQKQHEDIARELSQMTSRFERACDEAGGGASCGPTDSPPASAPREQTQLFKDHLEGALKEVKGELQRVSTEVDRSPKLAEDALSGLDTLQKEFRALKDHAEELAERAKEMQKEFAETTGAIREELIRLTELTVKCLSNAKEFPSELETLRQDVGALQEKLSLGACEGNLAGELETLRRDVGALQEKLARGGAESPATGLTVEAESLRRDVDALQEKVDAADVAGELGSLRQDLVVLQGKLAGQQAEGHTTDFSGELESLRRDVSALQEKCVARTVDSTGMAHVESPSMEQEELARAMASVRQELVRAKDLFQSGQKSAGVVLSDVEILRQDLKALKDRHLGLGGDPIEQLRCSLRQELADEFKSLTQLLIPSKAES